MSNCFRFYTISKPLSMQTLNSKVKTISYDKYMYCLMCVLRVLAKLYTKRNIKPTSVITQYTSAVVSCYRKIKKLLMFFLKTLPKKGSIYSPPVSFVQS